MANNQISIFPKWADIFDLTRGEDVPTDLIGAKIIEIGAPTCRKEIPEGGGLAIRYIPAHSTREKLIVLAFNDCGMWEEKSVH